MGLLDKLNEGFYNTKYRAIGQASAVKPPNHNSAMASNYLAIADSSTTSPSNASSSPTSPAILGTKKGDELSFYSFGRKRSNRRRRTN
jgi:hypothetical protein